MQHVKAYVLPIVLLGCFVICFYPAFEMLFYKWENSEDYTHAFFVVPIIFYIVWQKRSILQEREGSSILGGALVVLSLCFYYIASQVGVPTFLFVSVVLFVFSAMVYIGGFGSLPYFVTPLLLVVMIIPVPEQLLTAITAQLQLYVSQIGEAIIRAFSIPMLREGNVLHVEGKSFQVVDACSGIRSLISMTTLSLIIGYFTLFWKRSKIFLFLFSIPVALVVNIVRVSSMILVYHFYKVDITTGNPHTIAGLLLFGLGLLLLFTFQRVLESWEMRKISN